MQQDSHTGNQDTKDETPTFPFWGSQQEGSLAFWEGDRTNLDSKGFLLAPSQKPPYGHTCRALVTGHSPCFSPRPTAAGVVASG